MISVDLRKGVNAAQTALEEAKSLMRLEHEHIVGFKDVFLHRASASPEWHQNENVLE